MENNKKMVKLSTLICTIIISLLIIAIICLYFYFNPITTKTTNSGIEEANSKGDTSLNITQNKEQSNIQSNSANNEVVNSESNSQSTGEISQTNNSSSDTISQTGKYDIQYVKDTITLNGKEHTYEVRYSSNMEFFSTNVDYYSSDAQILFDDKIIGSTSLRITVDKKSPIGKVEKTIIKGYSNKENAIIYIEDEGEGCDFYFINEDAELIEKIYLSYGTSIAIDGKQVKYEINEDSFIWYETNLDPDSNADAVIKYKMSIFGNKTYFTVLETYKASEVELAGKV